MELRDYAQMARKWLWLFALSTAIAAVGAWLATMSMPTQYQSQATVVVGRELDDPTPDYLNLRLSETLAGTYADMATKQPVLEGVVEALQLQTNWQSLRGLVRASQVPGRSLIVIRVIDTDPQRAQLIADAVANQLIAVSPTPKNQDASNTVFLQSQVDTLQASITGAEAELLEIDGKIGLETSARAIADLQNRKAALESKMHAWRSQLAGFYGGLKGSETNTLWVIEKASIGSKVGPNAGMNVLLAAALGFGLALAAVLLLEYMDDTVKTVENAEKRVGVAGLATIERVTPVEHRRDGLVALLHPRSPIAEAFRVLRTNLEFSLLANPSGSIVITSPNPGEGKSTTAANLAVVMAQGGARVMLVDSDLRRPALHRFFDLPNSLGMTSLLLDHSLTLDDAAQPVENVPGLEVLTSGPLPPNPAEVLKSPRAKDLFKALSERADVVIMDSPPVLVVADAAILAQQADATMLVFDSGNTRTDSARKAVETLAKVGVEPIGAVVNLLDRERVGGYYYYYAYRYRYHYNDYYGDSSSGKGDGKAGGASTGGETRKRPRWVDRVVDGVTSLLS